jgi:hypothetical protein
VNPRRIFAKALCSARRKILGLMLLAAIYPCTVREMCADTVLERTRLFLYPE